MALVLVTLTKSSPDHVVCLSPFVRNAELRLVPVPPRGPCRLHRLLAPHHCLTPAPDPPHRINHRQAAGAPRLEEQQQLQELLCRDQQRLQSPLVRRGRRLSHLLTRLLRLPHRRGGGGRRVLRITASMRHWQRQWGRGGGCVSTWTTSPPQRHPSSGGGAHSGLEPP